MVTVAIIAFFIVCVVPGVIRGALQSAGILPTSIPAPTNTPFINPIESLHLTQTAEPTNTARPTNTPLATPDPYLDEMTKRIDSFGLAYNLFRSQHERLASDPNLVNDANWKLDMGNALAQLQVASEDLQNIPNLTPPFQNLDTALKTLAADSLALKENYITYIDQLDLSAYSRAVDNLTAINNDIQSATEEMDKIK